SVNFSRRRSRGAFCAKMKKTVNAYSTVYYLQSLSHPWMHLHTPSVGRSVDVYGRCLALAGLTARCCSASRSRRKNPETREYGLTDGGMDRFGKSGRQLVSQSFHDTVCGRYDFRDHGLNRRFRNSRRTSGLNKMSSLN